MIDRIFEAASDDPDIEWLAIGATVIRVPGSGGWSTAKMGSVHAQALSRSRGGFGTKIHAIVDALGLPVRFMLSLDRQNDMAFACDPIRGLPARQVLADSAYHTERLCALIKAQGGEAVIPPRKHRSIRRPYDGIAFMLWLK